ncbi:MAG: hypothetical protein FH758_12605 [Firmicutes bacterium]|nr:hypothetical protein [Bacillota bacterium]
MGLPKLPDVNQEQSLTDLLESIALEEGALAAMINAEAEKVQAVAVRMKLDNHLQRKIDFAEIIEFQKTVASIIKTMINMQMLLQFKMENVLDAKLQLEKKKLKSKLE